MNRVLWAGSLAVRKAYQNLLRVLYSDHETNAGKSVIVAGTARSGTTWLGDLLASEMRARVMFEPFHPDLVPEYAAFNYFQYMRPFEDDDQLLEFAEKVLTGRLKNRWVDRQVGTLRPRWRIIKEIRACLLLRWLHERFPQVGILFIIRDPRAVVCSRMQLGWATDDDISPLLRQPKLVEDHLSPWLQVIEGANTDEEKHAVVWGVHNALVLRQFQDSSLPVVFFEDMTRRPRDVIPRIFGYLGVEPSDAVYKASRRPSMTSRSSSGAVRGGNPVDGWRKHLSDEQVERIMDIVERLGLGGLFRPEGGRRGPLPPGIVDLSGEGSSWPEGPPPMDEERGPAKDG